MATNKIQEKIESVKSEDVKEAYNSNIANFHKSTASQK